MKHIPFTPKGEQFEPGMRVRILEGPFADFRGIIQKVDPLQEKAEEGNIETAATGKSIAGGRSQGQDGRISKE